MSKSPTAFVLGYHGCDREVGERLLLGGDFVASEQDFDWLGPGVYFWENDAQRALEWAVEKRKRGAYKEPFVVGAVIDLSNCLDLTIRENLDLLAVAYETFRAANEKAGLTMPENRDPAGVTSGDNLLRFLDCAVIRHLHENIAQEAAEILAKKGTPAIEPFTTVRGVFFEGGPAYPSGGFYAKTHTQIAAYDPRSIAGVFRPRPYPSI